ncbi:hypothetical protein LDENG_00237830 [Lucifuga dentata]|nr:hypothetical protein LDENG_00237830 [Lucifuga dentata]
MQNGWYGPLNLQVKAEETGQTALDEPEWKISPTDNISTCKTVREIYVKPRFYTLGFPCYITDRITYQRYRCHSILIIYNQCDNREEPLAKGQRWLCLHVRTL